MLDFRLFSVKSMKFSLALFSKIQVYIYIYIYIYIYTGERFKEGNDNWFSYQKVIKESKNSITLKS